MSSRILTIENKGKLSLKNNQLLFTSPEGIKKTVAIEDLECVIIESKEIVVTHSLLSRLASENVVLITTNEKYQASGILLSFFGHYKNLSVLELQMSVKKTLKNKLAFAIIKQKILNQALCLKKLNIVGSYKLIEYSKNINIKYLYLETGKSKRGLI